jgi:hypothetical protein
LISGIRCPNATYEEAPFHEDDCEQIDGMEIDSRVRNEKLFTNNEFRNAFKYLRISITCWIKHWHVPHHLMNSTNPSPTMQGSTGIILIIGGLLVIPMVYILVMLRCARSGGGPAGDGRYRGGGSLAFGLGAGLLGGWSLGGLPGVDLGGTGRQGRSNTGGNQGRNTGANLGGNRGHQWVDKQQLGMVSHRELLLKVVSRRTSRKGSARWQTTNKPTELLVDADAYRAGTLAEAERPG